MPITDLTGTTWGFNDEISLPIPGGLYQTFNINFISNSTNYTSLTDNSDSTPLDKSLWLQYNNTLAYEFVEEDGDVTTPPTWYNENYKTIEITGGTDVTNSTLIAWLQANATQQSTPTPTTQIALGRAFIKQTIENRYYLTWDNSSNTLNISVNGNIVSQGYELQDGDIVDIAIPQSMVGGLIVLVNNSSAPSSISDTDIYIDWVVQTSGGGSND